MISAAIHRISDEIREARISWHLRLADYYETQGDHLSMLFHWDRASALIRGRSAAQRERMGRK